MAQESDDQEQIDFVTAMSLFQVDAVVQHATGNTATIDAACELLATWIANNGDLLIPDDLMALNRIGAVLWESSSEEFRKKYTAD